MSDRLTANESFRARVWRNAHRREDVVALSHDAHRLLVGIVHLVLTPHNNSVLTLGPATMRRLGLPSRGGQVSAIHELITSNLLTSTTSGHQGRCTFYALTFLPLTIEGPRIRNLSTAGQVNLSTDRQVPPQNLSTGDKSCLQVDKLDRHFRHHI